MELETETQHLQVIAQLLVSRSAGLRQSIATYEKVAMDAKRLAIETPEMQGPLHAGSDYFLSVADAKRLELQKLQGALQYVERLGTRALLAYGTKPTEE